MAPSRAHKLSEPYELTPDDISVEIVSGQLNSQEQFLNRTPSTAQLNGSSPTETGVHTYHGEVTCRETGRLGITARIVPRNEHLLHTCRPKLISWW